MSCNGSRHAGLRAVAAQLLELAAARSSFSELSDLRGVMTALEAAVKVRELKFTIGRKSLDFIRMLFSPYAVSVIYLVRFV